MSEQHSDDPWNSLIPGELEYRQKLDNRNSRTINYKDASKNGIRLNGPPGKSFKNVQFSASTVAPEMETLADSAHYKKSLKKGSSYTVSSTTPHKGIAPSSSFLPSEDGVLYSKTNIELAQIGSNENLKPEHLQKIKHLLEESITNTNRTGFSEPSTESLVQDLYQKSQGKSQKQQRQQPQDGFGSAISQLFDTTSTTSNNSNTTTSSSSSSSSYHSKGEDGRDHSKKIKLEGGFGLIKFQTSKSSTKKSSSLVPTTAVSIPSKLKIPPLLVTPKPDVHDTTIGNTNGRRRTNKIGDMSGLSTFGKCLVDSTEFVQCTFGVAFCDCKCTGCEFVHTGTSGNLVPGSDCYYQSDESKIEYCKYDPRWNTSEFDSREIYDNFVGPILLFEESLEQQQQKRASSSKSKSLYKMCLLFAIEMFESNKQIMPLAISIFFTSNLDRIELNGTKSGNDSSSSDIISVQKIVKPYPFCWSNNMDVLFTKTDEEIKKSFNVEDVTKIVRQIKSVDSVNRRVCCNKFNRSDAELFEFLSCKNSGFMDASSGIIKLCNYEKDKHVVEKILKLSTASLPKTNRENDGNKKTMGNTPVSCRSTVDGVTYEYTKSYLVAIIDSKIPSNLNVMIRSCFVLANIYNQGGVDKNIDKEKLVNTICNFNSGDMGKKGEYSSASKYVFDALGNQTQPKSSSSSSSSSLSMNSAAIANQDTMTEESCFRPVMYKIDKLEGSHSGTMHGLMWNEIKMYRIWKYVRSYVIICPRSSNLENE